MLGNIAVTILLRGGFEVLPMVSISIRQPFSSHSQHRRLIRQRFDLVDLHPSQRVRFAADAKKIAAYDPNRKTGVEVMMRRIAAMGGYQMDVDVEQVIAHGLDFEPRFFARFTQGNTQRVGIAIAVAAQLQPAIQLAVMREEHMRTRFVDDPG